MQKPRFIIVGGFLGAGKTTAIARIADYVSCKGYRAGLITNDQSENLVDTARLRAGGFTVQEITGGCFCCRFDSLVSASRELTRTSAPDVLIAEPVGSCTDLKATVAYPLRQLYGDDYEIAPLSVLVDPVRCRQMMGLHSGTNFSDKVMYVYRKQLEEAELLVMNKTDLLDQVGRNGLYESLQKEFPQARILETSCKTGEGVQAWFDEIFDGTLGRRAAMDIDYDQYAEGEARLGWLNATAGIIAAPAADGDQLLAELAASLKDRLQLLGIEIAHLKLTLADGGSRLGSISLTRTDDQPHSTCLFEGSFTSGEVTINLRAEADPEVLREQVVASLGMLSSAASDVRVISAFRPGRPQPTHRLAAPPA